MTRRRLLFLISEDWFFCSHRLPLAVAAREAGYDVTVATRVTDDGDRIRAAGIDLVPLGWSRRGTHPLRELAALREVIRVYRRCRPDIVHHVAIKPVLYGSLAARVARVPFVVNAVAGLGYIFASHDARARLLRPVVRAGFHLLLDRDNARLILQNPDDVEQFTKSGIVDRQRVRLVRGSGVDLRRFTVVPEPPGEPVVVLPARMLRDKGVEEFVEAARTLRAEGLRARFVLAGEPDEENPACIAESRLLDWAREGIVEYWGWQEDMVSVFQGANIVCLPSYREGLPKALIEAAACGRAIVTTDVPGCREVVSDGDNGLLVAARDAIGLAAALRRLLRDPVLRGKMARRARERAEAEFSIDYVIRETLAVYRDLLNGRSATSAGGQVGSRGDA
ncbi:MAG: glycosyltransferase [Betaproteobacteria bacterium]|nr:glycosyltransferase [Betaproteobacteria bacterium]